MSSAMRLSAAYAAAPAARQPRAPAARPAGVKMSAGGAQSRAGAVRLWAPQRRTQRLIAYSSEQEAKETQESAAEVVEDETPETEMDEIVTPLQRLSTYVDSGIGPDDLAKMIPDLTAQFGAAEERSQAAAAQLASELETATKASKDSLARLSADFQNYRNRTEREKAEISDKVKAQVLEELIPLIDNFEAAKQFIKPETDGEKKIENSYQGLYKQMVDLFKKMGIEAVQTVGKPFDPAIHEAIMRQPTADVTEDTVIQEFRKGFRINGKLIRPAMVSVAVPDAEGGAAAAGAAAGAEEGASEGDGAAAGEEAKEEEKKE